MKTTAIAAVLAAAALFAGCAHAPVTAAKSAPCQEAPQWVVNTTGGTPAFGVYVCFGAHGELLYATRALTPAQVAALTPPPSASRNRPDEKDMADIAARKAKFFPAKKAASKMADPCAELDGPDYTACRIDQKAAKAPGEGLKAVK